MWWLLVDTLIAINIDRIFYVLPLRSIIFLRSRDLRVLFPVGWGCELNREVNYQLNNFSGRYNPWGKSLFSIEWAKKILPNNKGVVAQTSVLVLSYLNFKIALFFACSS
jgi:hypothetical protein